MKNINIRFITLLLIILIVSLTRLLPHAYNFTPLGAIALFGGAYFSRKFWAVLIPLVAVFVSDLLVNNILYASFNEGFVWVYSGFYWQYACYIIIAMMGMGMFNKVNVKNVALGALGSSILFFVVTNFAAWLGNPMYPQSFSGLMMSYTAGIPFFGGTLIGTLFYSGVLFGGFEWLKKLNPELATV